MTIQEIMFFATAIIVVGLGIVIRSGTEKIVAEVRMLRESIEKQHPK